MRKRNYAIWWNVIIFGVVAIGSLIAGNLFVKQTVTATKTIFSPTNPLLWIIGGIVIIVLMKRSQPEVIMVGR